MHRCRSTERSRHERTCPLFLPRSSIFGKPQPFHQSTYPESCMRPASILQLYADSITVIQPTFDKWLWFSHRQTQIFSGIPLFCVVVVFMYFCSPVDFIYSDWNPPFFGCSEIFQTSHKALNRLIRSLCGALEMFFILLSSSRSTTESSYIFSSAWIEANPRLYSSYGSWSVLQHLALFLSSPKERSSSESKGQRCQTAHTQESGS